MESIIVNNLNAEDLRSMIAEEVAKAMERKPAPRMLTREEVAEMAHVTLATVHNWMNKGILEPSKIGRRTLFNEDDLKAVLARKKR